jgi:hypothetical protein
LNITGTGIVNNSSNAVTFTSSDGAEAADLRWHCRWSSLQPAFDPSSMGSNLNLQFFGCLFDLLPKLPINLQAHFSNLAITALTAVFACATSFAIRALAVASSAIKASTWAVIPLFNDKDEIGIASEQSRDPCEVAVDVGLLQTPVSC